MSEEAQAIICKNFPGAFFRPEVQLLLWRPQGLFDEELGDRMLEFLEREEQRTGPPFHRYADLTCITDIRLRFGHTYQVAERRKSGYQGEPVKSAIFCDWIIGFGLARMYEALMEGAALQVKAFRKREEAAEYLGVPVTHLLFPDALCKE
jgi:hypothetical protein